MEDQGIMALPQAGMQAPTAQPQAAIDPKNFSPQVFDYAQMQPDQFGQDILGGMEAMDPALVAQFKQALAGMQLPSNVLDALGQMVDAILAEPEKYEEIRADFISEGVPEDILPPTFDAAYFATLNIALDQLSGQQTPVGMAGGGIMSLSPVAAGMARMGRNGDRMLAHITPAEARMLRRRGGSGTINPVTGQPEFFVKKLAKTVGNVFKSAGKAVTGLVKGVGNVVKKIASSDIGKIALTVAAVYFMGPAGLNLAGPTGLIGVSNAALATGINAFAGSTLVNLASGQKLGDAVKNGAISGVLAGVGTGVVKGFDATLPTGAPTGATTFDGIRQDPFIESDLVSGQAPPVSEGVIPQINAPTVADLTTGQQALSYDGSGIGQPTTNFASANIPGNTLTDTSSLAGSIQNNLVPSDVVPRGLPLEGSVPSTTVTSIQTPRDFVLANEPRPFITGPELGADRLPGAPSGMNFQTFEPSYDSLTRPGTNMAGAAINQATQGLTPQSGIMSTLEQGYNEYIRPYTPSGIAESGRATALQAYNDTLAATKSQKLAEAAYERALPGVFSTYGPTAAVGLGAAYLGGAFTPEEPGSPNLAPKETGTDLLRAQPGVYGTTPGGANVTYASLPSGYNYSPMQMLYRPQVTMGNPYGNIYGQRRMFAEGGIAALAPSKYNLGGYASGGIGSMAKKYPRRTGEISGPGTGTSDDIPAMLSDGEFVMTAKAVRGAGKGSRREGAKRMYAMMRKLEGKS